MHLSPMGFRTNVPALLAAIALAAPAPTDARQFKTSGSIVSDYPSLHAACRNRTTARVPGRHHV
jgi:hypothetical protein